MILNSPSSIKDPTSKNHMQRQGSSSGVSVLFLWIIFFLCSVSFVGGLLIEKFGMEFQELLRLLGIYFSGSVCILCTLERYGFLCGALVSLMALLWVGRRYRWTRFLTFVFFLGTLISGYHVAIQYKWVSNPSVCHVFQDDGDDLEIFKSQVVKAPCDRITFTFLGIPFSVISSMLMVVLMLCSMYSGRLQRRRMIS
jgi:disulfide bond formation protein DsbB